MPNPVEIEDLEARFRPLSDTEKVTAQAWLEDAWAILLTRRPLLDQYMSDGAVSPALVTSVVSAMVLRVLRNPEGYKRWAIDDGNFERDSAVASGALYVSDAELMLLSPAGTGDGAFSIRPIARGAYAYPPDPWVPGLTL